VSGASAPVRGGALAILLVGVALCGGCGGAARSLSPASEAVSEPIRYLPGGRRVLASRRVPRIGKVSIIAKRYVFQGHVYLDIADEIEQPSGGGGGSGVRDEGRSPLSWSLSGYCPQAGGTAAVVVFGVLRASGDEVFAYSHQGPRRLWTVPIPAYLQAGGKAVYTVLTEAPERILVRAPSGGTVMDEALGTGGPTGCVSRGGIVYFGRTS
jgi:hypothetical protein